MKKICTKCEKEKDIEEFSIRRETKCGRTSHCKACAKEKYELNKDKILEAQKKYIEKNKEKRLKYRKEYYSRPEIKIKKLKDDSDYRKNNKEKVAKMKPDWYQNNKGDIERKIKGNLRTRVGRTISKGYKSASTMELLGCSYECFIEYISNKFDENMCWENYGKFGWHIDHIKPCASFDLKDPEQQKLCFHYTNLQPLWWRDNIIKSDTWEE